jgi:hypothetical protein
MEARWALSIFRSNKKEKKPRPVPVFFAANQAEAEMIEGILASEGIFCLIQRTGSADVPDFLAAGRRQVLVPASAETKARELLDQLKADHLPED